MLLHGTLPFGVTFYDKGNSLFNIIFNNSMGDFFMKTKCPRLYERVHSKVVHAHYIPIYTYVMYLTLCNYIIRTIQINVPCCTRGRFILFHVLFYDNANFNLLFNKLYAISNLLSIIAQLISVYKLIVIQLIIM